MNIKKCAHTPHTHIFTLKHTHIHARPFPLPRLCNPNARDSLTEASWAHLVIAVYFGMLGNSFIHYHVELMTCVSGEMHHVGWKRWPGGGGGVCAERGFGDRRCCILPRYSTKSSLLSFEHASFFIWTRGLGLRDHHVVYLQRPSSNNVTCKAHVMWPTASGINNLFVVRLLANLFLQKDKRNVN